MSIKLTIMDQMRQIAREHGKTLAPLLLDGGHSADLDSSTRALLARLRRPD